MTQGTNNIWKAGKAIIAGNGDNEFVSLIRPNPTPTQPATSTDAYATANQPSHVISQGERPNTNSIAARSVPPKFRNA